MPVPRFPAAVSTDRLLRAFKWFLLVASSLGALAWAGPFWSLDYLYHDIMRAKSGHHRIYEVLVDTCEFIRKDTILIPKRHLWMNIPASELDDTLIQPFDIHKIRFKVLSTLTADPFPTHVPLIAFDKRSQYGYEWKKGFTRMKAKGEVHIVVLDGHGCIVAMYPAVSLVLMEKGEKSIISIRLKDDIQAETLRLLDSKEYAGFVDRKNVLRILKKNGVIW